MLTSLIESLLNTFLAGKASLVQHSVLLIVYLVIEVEKPNIDGPTKKAAVLAQAEGVLTSAGFPAWLVNFVAPRLIDYIVAYCNKSGLFKH